MSKKIALGQVEIARDVYENIKHQYLRQEGWTRTCASPDHCWQWSKQFPMVGLLTLDEDEAFSVEQHLDEGEEL